MVKKKQVKKNNDKKNNNGNNMKKYILYLIIGIFILYIILKLSSYISGGKKTKEGFAVAEYPKFKDNLILHIPFKDGTSNDFSGNENHGTVVGFNKDSQYNVFEQDGDLVFFRNVNGVINIIIAAGNSGTLETDVEGYSGIITFGRGEGIEIYINQSN